MHTITIIITAFIAQIAALNSTMCDCSNAKRSTMIAFDDEQCNNPENAVNHVEVMYQLFTDATVPVAVIGYACTTWMRRGTIARSYFGDEDFETSTLALETSPEECMEMATNGMCGKSYMQKVGKTKFAFTGDPIGAGTRDETVTLQLKICAYQEVNISHSCPSCDLHTPVGPAKIEDGTISRAHVAVIWNKNSTKHSPCKERFLSPDDAIAVVSWDNRNKTIRLVDDKAQLDFIMSFVPTR